MKILLLADGVPYPPDSGSRVKTFQLLRHLASRHEVTLVYTDRDPAAAAQAVALRPYCAAIYHATAGAPAPSLGARMDSLLGRGPALLARAHTERLHRLLARVVAEAAAAGSPFDVVHVDQLTMAQFAERLPLPRLLDAQRATYRIYERSALRHRLLRRWLERREAALLRAYEGRICARFEAVAAASAADAEDLLAAAGVRRLVHVLPPGLDGAALMPVARCVRPLTILSLAAPGSPPDAEGLRWFIREVLPLVRRAVPESRLAVCEAGASAELRQLCAATPGVIALRPGEQGRNQEQVAVAIAPLRSPGGTATALLEAMARGLPVVATGLACEGLELRAGEHLLVADQASEFADAVALLVSDPELGERIAAAGRAQALARYDWRVLGPGVDRIYARMAEAGGEPAAGSQPAVDRPVSALQRS